MTNFLPIIIKALALVLVLVYQQPGDHITGIVRHNGSGALYAGTRDGRILKSTDAGATWANNLIDAPAPSPVFTMLALSNNVILAGGYSVSENGRRVLIRSADNGGSWSDVTPPDMLEIRDMVQTASGAVVAVGLSRNISATIWRSVDGATFQSVLPDQKRDYPFQAVVVAADGAILAVVGSDVYRSANDGVTWDKYSSIPYGAWKIVKLSTGELIAVNSYKGFGLYRSLNDGLSWVSPNAEDSYSIIFLALATGETGAIYAIQQGNPQKLVRSTDLGDTWATVATLAGPTDGAAVHGLFFDPVSRRLLVGTGDGINGTIWRSEVIP